MTFHKNFFHKSIHEIRKNGFSGPLIVGGPHPTTSFQEVLKDKNIDLCVLGEGENTLSEIVSLLMKKKEFNFENLKNIDGIAFDTEKFKKNLIKNKNKLINNDRISISASF